jgi:hypothetical protein
MEYVVFSTANAALRALRSREKLYENGPYARLCRGENRLAIARETAAVGPSRLKAIGRRRRGPAR